MIQIERIQHMEQSLDAANAAIIEMSTALEKYIAAHGGRTTRPMKPESCHLN